MNEIKYGPAGQMYVKTKGHLSSITLNAETNHPDGGVSYENSRVEFVFTCGDNQYTFHVPYMECQKLFSLEQQKPVWNKKGEKHYKGCAIEPVEYNHKNKLSFIIGNVIKYATRSQHGSPDPVKDLKKAIHYCEMSLEMEHDYVRSQSDS